MILRIHTTKSMRTTGCMRNKRDYWLRIVTVPEVQEEARRNGVETAKNRDKSLNCGFYVTCVDVCCS